MSICPRKWDHFYKFTWKLDLPLLSRAEIFIRIKQFCWFDLKIWHGPIIASWNFRKNIGAVLLKWFENSHCLYYHELKFSRKYSSFVDVIWKFKLPLLSRAEIFSEIKQFCWCALKIRNAPIDAEAEIFSKIKQFCRNDLTISSYLNILAAMISRGKIFSKVRFFVNMTWKFDLCLLSRAEIFAKVRQFSWSKFKHWIAPIITS